MPFLPTDIPDLVLYQPEVHSDGRGYFTETYSEEDFLQGGIVSAFVQDNEVYSRRRVLRGLHYQVPPHGQAKLIRVVVGEVLDVAVDIREGSPTFGQYFRVALSAENKLQLYIPRGFAHGYLVLSDSAIVHNKCDNLYQPESEGGIRFDDPNLSIDWPIDHDKVILSDKDRKLPILGSHPEYHL